MKGPTVVGAIEAAAIIASEIGSWPFLNDGDTKAQIARVIALMPDTAQDVESLREVAQKAYREVMLRQSVRLTKLAIDLENEGPSDFINRASDALKGILTNVK